jgi:hypothetical protein
MNFKLEHMLALSPLEGTLSLDLILILGGTSHAVTWHQIFWLEENWEKGIVLTLIVNLEEV